MLRLSSATLSELKIKVLTVFDPGGTVSPHAFSNGSGSLPLQLEPQFLVYAQYLKCSLITPVVAEENDRMVFAESPAKKLRSKSFSGVVQEPIGCYLVFEEFFMVENVREAMTAWILLLFVLLQMDHAEKHSLNTTVAIRLRSTFTGRDDYILGFFLLVNCQGSLEQLSDADDSTGNMFAEMLERGQCATATSDEV